MRYYTDSPAQYNDFSPSAGTTSFDAWYDIEHRITSSTYHMYRDGTDYTGAYRAASRTTSTYFQTMPAMNQTNSVYYDDIYVRQYVASEPQYTFGGEESYVIPSGVKIEGGILNINGGVMQIR